MDSYLKTLLLAFGMSIVVFSVFVLLAYFYDDISFFSSNQPYLISMLSKKIFIYALEPYSVI